MKERTSLLILQILKREGVIANIYVHTFSNLDDMDKLPEKQTIKKLM